MKRKSTLAWLPLAALLALSGCARHQYRIVEPDRFAQPLGERPARVYYEPLHYWFAERDRQLAVGINNPTDDPITLVGNKSYVVDPDGMSHPLRSRTIAPHSHIGFLLPPEHLALRLDRSSRSGNGFGSEYLFGFGSDSESHPFLHPDFGVYLPSYYGSGYEYFVEEIPYWERKRGQIALRFFYERDQGGAFDHRFLLRREKVE